jgi:hypothetical protein
VSTVEERLVRVETWQENREKLYDERNSRIEARMERIDANVLAFSDKLDKGLADLRAMREDSDSKHRHALNNGLANAQGAVTQLRQETNAAIAKAADECEDRSEKLDGDIRAIERGGRGYVERALTFALGSAIASIVYLAAPYVSKLMGGH